MLSAARTLSSKPSCSRPAGASRARLLVARADAGNGSTNAFAEGAKVKVVKPIKVYHVPKAPASGIDLEGMEGEVIKNATLFKGKVLSANLPYVVKFTTNVGGSDVKFQAHLVGVPGCWLLLPLEPVTLPRRWRCYQWAALVSFVCYCHNQPDTLACSPVCRARTSCHPHELLLSSELTSHRVQLQAGCWTGIFDP
jgi:hypothetical protein